MKTIILTIFTLSLFNTLAAGGSSGGGGTPITSILKANIHEQIQSPITNNQIQEFIDKIDNIEFNHEFNYPKSFQEKINLLKKENIQSIQLIDGSVFFLK